MSAGKVDDLMGELRLFLVDSLGLKLNNASDSGELAMFSEKFLLGAYERGYEQGRWDARGPE